MNTTTTNKIKEFVISLWPGQGYSVNEFRAKAECLEDALDEVAKNMTEEERKIYCIDMYDFDEELEAVEDYFKSEELAMDEMNSKYWYVGALGLNLRIENMKVQEAC